MGFLNRNSASPLFAVSNQNDSVTPSSVNANQENNTMNQPNSTVTAQQIFDDRREWTVKGGLARLSFSVEQIAEMHPDADYLDLFAKKQVRITQATNDTRKENIAVVFRNRVQDDQTGRTLALKKHVRYAAGYAEYSAGFRAIALLDLDGDHDVVVQEERDVNSGHIIYNAYYGTKSYNNHGQPNGLNRGAMITRLNDDINRRVVGYNEWVVAHDADVLAASKVWPNIVATKAMSKFELGENANNFVQINSVTYKINYSSIINKYALLALLLVPAKNADGVAFEVFSRAKDAAGTEKFINGAMTNMTWGFQSQLKALSGIEFVPKA